MSNSATFKTMTLLLFTLFFYGSGILITIIAADVLTVSQYGLLNYLYTIGGVAGSLIALGCDTSPLQFLNKYLHQKHLQNVTDFIHWSIKHISLVPIISIIASIAIFFIIDPLELFYEPRLEPFSKVLATGFLIGTLSAVINILSSYLMCNKQVVLSTFLSSLIINASIILLFVLGYYAFGLEQDVLNVALILITLAYAFSAIASIMIVKRFMPILFTIVGNYFQDKKIKNKNPKWHKSAKSQLLKNLLTQFKFRIDFILLGCFASNYHDLAFYALACTISKFLYVVPIGICKNLIPEISFITNGDEERAAFQQKWNKALMKNIVFLVILYGSILYFNQAIVVHLYGSNYAPACNILPIILTGYLSDCLYGSKLSIMAYTGLANYTSFSYLLQLVIFLLGILILGHDPIHVAYASATALALAALFCTYIIRSKLNFRVAGLF